MNPTNRGGKKEVTNTRVQERVNYMKGMDEHMTIRKESNMFNSESQKNPKMNKG
jgi:hypothetical protein